MRIRRIVLWKKQRDFLDACLASNATQSQVQEKLKIPNRMLMAWHEKPAFARQYLRVKRFLKEKGRMDLIISSAHGANLIGQQQLKRNGKYAKPDKTTFAVISHVHTRKRRSRAKKLAAPKSLAHPDNTPQERRRLLAILANRKRSK
jgi:hypothetical protein